MDMMQKISIGCQNIKRKSLTAVDIKCFARIILSFSCVSFSYGGYLNIKLTVTKHNLEMQQIGFKITASIPGCLVPMEEVKLIKRCRR